MLVVMVPVEGLNGEEEEVRVARRRALLIFRTKTASSAAGTSSCQV